ncbi:unnamed protein product [Cuscuta epithymum]|uniref:Protein FAR1-RELATED SEQUENCE n=1 Tax=Cuscuta epithymum TaxID=186058 RepID=A0AAV0FSG1_9ASTE|nr:unnamed protein product [Cuscuta epithymum]
MMKCYRLYKETVGGYANIGATSVDFKNFKRDLKAYLVGVDAQRLIDKLFRKKETSSAFSFDYVVDESDQLTRIFWVDPVCVKNYALFGDVVSFDATYETTGITWFLPLSPALIITKSALLLVWVCFLRRTWNHIFNYFVVF